MKESNVSLHSNIYVLTKSSCSEDKELLSRVTGRVSLIKMIAYLSGVRERGINNEIAHRYLTSIQYDEYNNGIECYLDASGHITWGKVLIDGRERTVCRCRNSACRRFQQCRPGVDIMNPSILQQWPTAEEIEIQPQYEVADGPATSRESVFITDEISLSDVKVLKILNEKTLNEEEKHNKKEIQIPQSTVLSITSRVSSGYENKATSVRLPDSIRQLFQSNLTSQSDIIERPPDERILVIAGPGTGKTYSVIERLKHLHITYGISSKILVLCFTRAAVREIKDRLRDLQMSGFEELNYLYVRTFDSFATHMLTERGKSVANLSYDARIDLAVKEIQEHDDIFEDFEHVIVDEIQDLVGVRARLVLEILRTSNVGFTLLGDPLQGIYDWQIKDKPGEITSYQFLNTLLETYGSKLKTITLRENYRQCSELESFNKELRRHLEESTIDSVQDFFTVLARIPSIDKFADISLDLTTGKVSLLCPNNGLALKASYCLRQREIAHVLKTNTSQEDLLPRWFAPLLTEFEYITPEVIDCFKNKFSIPERLYEILLQITNSNGPVIPSVELRGVIANRVAMKSLLPAELYKGMEEDWLVTTVHQSKGREFDNVLFMQDSYTRDNSLDKKIEEAKVCYVASTRARKNLFSLQDEVRFWRRKKVYFQPDDSTRRWFGCYWYNAKKKIVSFEVGLADDICELSFVDRNLHGNVSVIQDYINTLVQPGDEVELIRESRDATIFNLVHNGKVLGYTTPNFANEMKRIFEYTLDYCPEAFKYTYVDKIFTVSRLPETLGHNIPEPYCTTGIWLGISIKGLAFPIWDAVKYGGVL